MHIENSSISFNYFSYWRTVTNLIITFLLTRRYSLTVTGLLSKAVVAAVVASGTWSRSSACWKPG